METLFTILSPFLGCTTLLGFILYNKASRRIKNAEAKRAEAEAKQARAEVDKSEVSRLHGEIDHMQKIIDNLTELDKTHTERMGKLNSEIDKHIDRNRELSDRLYSSETELNRRNEHIEELTAKLGNALLVRCERTDCKDPRGPKPPRNKSKEAKPEAPNP